MNKEVKFQTLHKKINVKCVVIGVLVVTLIVLVMVNRVSHASFISSLDIPFVRGKINYKHPDFKVMGMYVQASSGSSTYNETNTMPSGNDYVINEDKSYCNKGNTSEKDSGVVLKTVNGNHVMNNLTKNDRCFLYFDESYNVASILAKYTKDDSRNGEITAGFIGSTPTTVYSKEDDDGTSYVFAGVNPNNWVKIGDIYFRIIRFNGNGSMRLIYSGTGSPEVSGEGTQIGTKEFNINEDDNMYVGLQYTSNNAHGNSTNSNILGEINSNDKITLYGWYNDYIGKNFDSLVDKNVGFCSDRRNTNSNNGSVENPGKYGIGTIETYYSGYFKITSDPYLTDLKCYANGDLLKLPVGLITADEVQLAGAPKLGSEGCSDYKNCFWLYTSKDYWTMTPGTSSFSTYNTIRNLTVHAYGHLASPSITSELGVRPVINLKSTTTFESNEADGSSLKPYEVKI